MGRRLSVCGWVAKRREHGEHLAFLDVRDRSGILQAVVDGSVDVRSEYVVRVTGTVARRPRGHGQRAPRHRRGRADRLRGRGPVGRRAAAVPARRPRRHRRAGAPALPLPGPAPRADAAQPAPARGGQPRRCARRWTPRASARSRRRCCGRRPPRARASSSCPSRLHARRVLRPAPEPPDRQAAAHGRRLRPLLPDRAVPARRGPARRPPVRVHPARHRGQLRHPRRRAGLRLARGARRRRGRDRRATRRRSTR